MPENDGQAKTNANIDKKMDIGPKNENAKKINISFIVRFPLIRTSNTQQRTNATTHEIVQIKKYSFFALLYLDFLTIRYPI